MKIAVPAEKGELNAEMDRHFGRAACFVVVDPDTWDFEVVENTQNVNAASGAGIQAARTIASSGATVLIASNCGPNAFRTLDAAGVKIFTGAEGTVKEIVTAYKNGELKPAGDANVDAHNGVL